MVLDLAQRSIRRMLGVTLRQLNGLPDSATGRQLGDAAYDAGFEGIIYPRPLKRNRRNLALLSVVILSQRSLDCWL